MNKILRLSLIALLAIFCGGGTISAVETNIYSYVPVANSKNNAYANTYDVECKGMTWNVPGNQLEDNGLRIGGKQITNVDRTITGKTTFSQIITKVVVNHGGISNTNFKVNSIKLTSATDAGFTTGLQSCTYTPATDEIKLNTDGSITLKLSEGSFAKNSYYKIDFNVSNSTKNNYYIKIKSIDFYADVNAGDVVKDPVINIESGVYTEQQTVSITQEDSKDIYYTTDGSDPKVSETAEKYTAPFTVSTTTTIKAAAKDGDNWSSVVTSTIAIAKEYASFKELQENVTATSQPAVINFNEAIITGINGGQAYVVDKDGYGALIYESEHGFEVGDKITGKAIGAFVLYAGKTEITGIKSTSEGLEITKGNTVPVTETTLDAIILKDQSSVVTIKNLTLDEIVTANKEVSLTDGTNKVTLYDTFKITLPEFKENMTYSVTGVVVWFNTSFNIAPRSEADIVGVPTSISGITTDATNENAPIFNLAGQRVNKNAKGILIQNGKKFINK